jgi:TPR repeat protein
MAEEGDINQMLLYANMLAEGYGVQKNVAEARKWLEKCAASPNDPFDSPIRAKELLKHLPKE